MEPARPRPKRPVSPIVRAKWFWRTLVSGVFLGYWIGYYHFISAWLHPFKTQEGFFLFSVGSSLAAIAYYCYMKASFTPPGQPPPGWVRFVCVRVFWLFFFKPRHHRGTRLPNNLQCKWRIMLCSKIILSCFVFSPVFVLFLRRDVLGVLRSGDVLLHSH